MSITEIQAIEQFVPHLRRFARALLNDVAEADGLVRDCLDEAALHHHQQEPVTNLRVWLFTILHRQYVRRCSHGGNDGAAPVPQEQEGRSGDCPSEVVVGFTVRDFKNAFRQLPAEDQQILLLVGLEGMSHRETAEVLGLPLGTLMLRLWQIKKRLRSIELRTNGLQAPMVRPLPRSQILRHSGTATSGKCTAAVVRLAGQ